MYLEILLREGGWVWVPQVMAYHRVDIQGKQILCFYDGPPWPRIRVIDEFILCTQCLRLPAIQEDLLHEVGWISVGKVLEYLSTDPDFVRYVPSQSTNIQSDVSKSSQRVPKTEEELLRLKRNRIAKQVDEQKKDCLSFNYRYDRQEVGHQQVELLRKSRSTSWVQRAAGRLFQDGQVARYGLSTVKFTELQELLPNHQFTMRDEFQEVITIYEIHEWPESVIELIVSFANKKSISIFEHEVHEIFNLRNRLIDSLHFTRGFDDATKSKGFKQFDWMSPPEDWRTD